MGVFNHPNSKSHIIPMLLIIVSLLLLNTGLRTHLAGEGVVASIGVPYFETFDSNFATQFRTLNGSWYVQDGQLIQSTTNGYDRATLIPIELEADIEHTVSVDIKLIKGGFGGGLLFNAQNLQSRQQSHMVRFNIDADALYLIFGYFGDEGDFIGQGSVRLDMPTNTSDWQSLQVHISQDQYDVLLGEAMIAREVPLVYFGGAIGLVASNSQVAFDNLSIDFASLGESNASNDDYSLINATELTDAVNRYTDNVMTTGDALWIPFSGEWDINDGMLIQSESSGFDYGSGYNQAVTAPFSLQTTTTHLSDNRGAGLFFNMRAPDSKNQAHIVRFVPDADFIVWGYFDAEGAFFAQGSTPIPPSTTVSDILEVTVGENAYAIYLNGQILIEGTETVYDGDYIGLVTAQSAAQFTNTRVASLPIKETSTVTDILPSSDYTLDAISGNWEFGEVILQTSTESTDYVAGTGVAAEQFAVNVTISLPQDEPEAGAGIMFHMAGRDDVASSQMVRFGSGGNEIFWGSYDNNRIFTGAGSMQLSLDWAQSHDLTIIAQATTYDILIDDEPIITEIPLQQNFGWIGLVSYRGTVTFENFELQLGVS